MLYGILKTMSVRELLSKDYINEIRSILGEETEEFLKSYEEDPRRSLRINTLKGSADDFLSLGLFDIKENDRVSFCPDGFYFEDDEAGKHPLHNAGAYYIQEASAMSPVMELSPKPGERILDLCASPGGKSTQIASFLKNRGILISNEINGNRAKILSENIERMGIANALVISHDPTELPEHFEGFFDRILIDAPCSGEGMFRKNPEAIAEWSPENVRLCTERQHYILNEADKMLKAGGRLVYSTCTFNESEDEGSIETFLKEHPEYKLLKKHKIWPHKEKGEGHFLAVLTKGEEVFEEAADGAFPKGGFVTGVKNKDIALFDEFAAENLKLDIRKIYGETEGKFIFFGDELYIVPGDFPDMKGLKVLRSGLHLGTLKKNRFEPSHSLALFLKKGDAVRTSELSKEEAVNYLKGMTLNKEGKKGYHLLTHMGYSIGWGKLSGNIMKNHYPKGLRNF